MFEKSDKHLIPFFLLPFWTASDEAAAGSQGVLISPLVLFRSKLCNVNPPSIFPPPLPPFLL